MLNEVRHRLELKEEELSPYATKSSESRGRLTLEEPSSLRTEFQRDRDRIIHCNAFRRLKHKTQVFIAPLGDHFSTRLTHTLEVAQIARTIARALNLNEDLTEAIALGHDLGHTPFGHGGEETMDALAPDGPEAGCRAVQDLSPQAYPRRDLTAQLVQVRDVLHYCGQQRHVDRRVPHPGTGPSLDLQRLGYPEQVEPGKDSAQSGPGHLG